MLRLERMEVSGFKSFPDKTVVDFPNGITAVVGPNGCGKSNIADAIQWVLGEQSARALRGQKMEDVIFNGSSKRGAGGMAEVCLQMIARAETLSFGRGRVTLTRRLFRSGESEYLIDGKKARLGDVRDLLDEVRAGVRTYAIIDQAQVASFVTSKPRERRVFIEEAAGIAGYKNRRRLAELKLEATRANLLRVDDILREVERQRRSLQRQAGLARRARKLEEEHRELKTYWFATKGRELGRQVRALVESLAVAKTEATHLEQERLRLEALAAAARARLEEAHDERGRLTEEMHRARLEEERLGRDVETALERASELEREAGRREGEGRQVEEERERRRRDVAAQEAALAELDELLASLEARLKEVRAGVDAERAELARGQQEAQRIERALYEKLRAQADLSARLSAAREARAREEKRAEEAAHAREKLASQLEQAKTAYVAAEEDSRRAGEEADRLVAAVQASRRAEDDAGRGLEEARTEDARIAAELGKRAGEKAALDSLAVRLAGADAARKMMELARAGKLSARSVVADLVTVEQDAERAAEAFLAGTLPAIVVDDAAEALKGAKLGVQGRVGFLPLDAPCGASAGFAALPDELAADPRVRGRLGAKVAAHDGVNGALSGRFEDAVLVDSLETAVELHRRFPTFNFLSPEGHAVHASGLVTVEGAGDAHRDGLLARARRREELAREVAALEERRAEAHEKLERARAELHDAQTARRTAEEKLNEARRAASTARLAFEQSGREQHRLERELALAGQVREAAEKGREEARARAEKLEGEVVAAEKAAEAARVELDAAREAVRTREESAREAAAGLGGLNSERGVRLERRASLARDLDRLRREINELEARSQMGAEAKRKALEDAQRLRQKSAEARAALEAVAERRAELERRAQGGAATVEARAAEVRAAEARLGRVSEEWEAARGRRERLALDAGRAQSDHEHMLADCRESLGLDPEELPAARPEGVDPGLLDDDHLLAERIADLRGKREKLGPVNLLAEQEFDELSTRYEELSTQHQDLSQSVEELSASIRKMDRESRERFLEAFAEVRRHFREQFSLLFRGGRGDLVLDDEENPLDCGIEILCQPPGKKLQAVSLLSGGEKALAATAVLFSIFKYQPPPFCLLDEVDAPLDDANVGRFNDGVRQFAENTQFIIVTHNKRTMEIADILYGVTMPEPGCSKLVSMTMD